MYKAILIDDEPWALYALEHGISWKEKGFEIAATAGNAPDGLQLIMELNPDVVFTDVRMDEMTGIELLKEARARNIECEFVIVSAYGDFSYAKEAIQSGIFDYLVKPVEKADGNKLLERLSAQLAKKKTLEKQLQTAVLPKETKNYEAVNKNFIELLHYVDAHFTEELSLDLLSEKYFLNTSYICVLFKKITNETFSSYLNNLRLKEAYRLLLTTDDAIAEIAELSGYRDYYYFNKAFKKKFGVSPRQCRLEGRKGIDEEKV